MKLIIATTNKDKLTQFKMLLGELKNVELLTLNDINYLDDIEETGTTYEQNSEIKADTICKATGLITLGEDSGLEIDALPNILGLYTARFEKQLTKKEKLEKILALLKNVPDEKRTARFVSAITCTFPNGHKIKAKAILEGHISHEIVNLENSSAYTPIFIKKGESEPQAILPKEEYFKQNHRALAIKKFINKFTKYVSANNF
jgi:XTP/dITP diphosphohydrolase